eukprot:SAG11_NODE_22303_length_408_cov_1.100324_1_plen_41_part_10
MSSLARILAYNLLCRPLELRKVGTPKSLFQLSVSKIWVFES